MSLEQWLRWAQLAGALTFVLAISIVMSLFGSGA